MRSLVAVAIVLAAAPALASPEGDVEALVRGTVDHLADGGSATGFVKGATVIGIHHDVFDFDTGKVLHGEHRWVPDGTDLYDFKTYGRLWPMLFGKAKPSGTRKLGKVSVLLDATGRTAWFSAPLDLSDKRTFHLSGAAELRDGKWALRVFDGELAIPDAELAQHPVLAARPMMVAAAPDASVGKAIVRWFTSRSLGAHAAKGVVLASGSAPAEVFAGAAAVKFAGTLDKLDLLPVDVVGTDTSAVITGTAWLPISKEERDGVIEFGFTVYAEPTTGVGKDGTDWRWRAIHFACDQVPKWGVDD